MRRQENEFNLAFEEVKKFFVDEFGAKIKSRGREIVKRCHVCGDSRDLTDAHMYIGVKNGAIVYHCFKCDAGGLVDGKFFRDISVYNPDLIILCNNQNKTASERSGYIRSRYIAINTPYIGVDTSKPQSMEKLNYLNSRLGVNISFKEACGKKIIFNLHEYLQANKVDFITRHQKVIDELDRWFIGFLSIDNKFINMRRIDNGSRDLFTDKRYAIYNIYDELDNTRRYYILPTSIDVLKPIEVHIAEGAFDILSIHKRKYQEGANQLFMSIGGKAYSAAIKYLLVDYGFLNMDIHLYVDGDIKDYVLECIKVQLRAYMHSLTIHRNIYPGEKDFGVPQDKINEHVYKLRGE